jgi:hypothetical protein
MQAARLAAELSEKATGIDVQRAAALAHAKVAGAFDAKMEAIERERARERERPSAWQHAPRDDSPPPAPERLFGAYDVSDRDPLAAYFALEATPPDDLPEAPDPAAPRPIASERGAPGAGGD